jgi:hypothetical protein
MSSEAKDAGTTEASLCAATEGWLARVAAVPAAVLECSMGAIPDVYVADALGLKAQ